MKNPLVRILIFGSLLALVFFIVFGAKLPSQNDKRIIVGDAEFAYLLASWQRTWQRQPTKEEFAGILQGYVKDEVTYHEALEQGLDKHNAMVKRAIIMQMDLLSTSQGEQKSITEDDIKAYYELRQDQFLKPGEITFSQLFFNKDLHKGDLKAEVTKIVSELNAKSITPKNASEYGDPTLLERHFTTETDFQINRTFGDGFYTQLIELPQGKWIGPINSTYGLHILFISEVTPSEPYPLDRVKGDIVDAITYEEEQSSKEQFYTDMLQEYDIVYEGEAKAFMNVQ